MTVSLVCLFNGPNLNRLGSGRDPATEGLETSGE